MSYLLIDLEKSATKLHQISPEAGAVYVFTKNWHNNLPSNIAPQK